LIWDTVIHEKGVMMVARAELVRVLEAYYQSHIRALVSRTDGARFRCICDACHDARAIFDDQNPEFVDRVKTLEATIEPVRDWYEGNGDRDVVDMLKDAIADLQDDRSMNIKLRHRVKILTQRLEFIRKGID
jgi:hypothetical protein